MNFNLIYDKSFYLRKLPSNQTVLKYIPTEIILQNGIGLVIKIKSSNKHALRIKIIIMEIILPDKILMNKNELCLEMNTNKIKYPAQSI